MRNIMKNGYDSGYESENDAYVAEINTATKNAKTELDQIGNIIARELTTIVERRNVGIVDVTIPEMVEARESLLNAKADPHNPNIGTFSLAVVMENINKDIGKHIKRGVPSEFFDKLRREINESKNKLIKDLSTNAGVESLINKRNILRMFESAPIMRRTDDNSLKNLPPEQLNILFGQLAKNIDNIPPEFSRLMILSGAFPTKALPELTQKINDTILNLFTDISDNKKYGILDEVKLTEENFKKFGKVINGFIKEAHEENKFVENLKKTLSNGVMEQVFQKIEKTKTQISDEEKKKITEQLLPSLVKLSYQSLTADSNIIPNLVTELVQKRTWYSAITNKLNISAQNLKNIAANIERDQEKIIRRSQSAPEFKPLNGIKISDDIKRCLSNNNMHDPSQIVVKSNYKKEPEVNTKIDEIVDNMLKKETLKIDQKQRKKIIDNLSGALSDLEPAYLKENWGDIKEFLTQELKQRKDSNLFSKNIAIKTEKLREVVDNFTKIHGTANDELIAKKIQDQTVGKSMKDSMFIDRISKFINSNNIRGKKSPPSTNIETLRKVPGKIKFLNNQQLLDIRKLDPMRYYSRHLQSRSQNPNRHHLYHQEA